MNRLPNGQYNIIYADPPWSYNDKCTAGKRGAEFKYPCLSLQDLRKLNVPRLAADDCALFMWSTFPMMQEAFDLMRSWGFKYKTVAFVWVKTTKHGKEHFGMGNWTRANAEMVLLGTKGKPKRLNAGVRQIVTAYTGEHSKKPHEVRERIVKLLGDVPRVELFAREKADGWKGWGNEL